MPKRRASELPTMAPPRNATPMRSPSLFGTLASSQAPVDRIRAFSLSRDGPERHPDVRRRARLLVGNGGLAGGVDQRWGNHPIARRCWICFAWLGLDHTVWGCNWSTTDSWAWPTAPAHRVHRTRGAPRLPTPAAWRLVSSRVKPAVKATPFCSLAPAFS